jgi:hypothetical protein
MKTYHQAHRPAVEIWAGDKPGGTLYMAVWRVRTLGRSDVQMFGNSNIEMSS